MNRLLIATTILTLAAGLAVAAEPKPQRLARDTGARAIGVVIYKVSGVVDRGAIGFFDATVAHCTNFTAAEVQIEFVVRDSAGDAYDDRTVIVGAGDTFTYATSNTATYRENLVGPGDTTEIQQGSMIIRSTSTNVFCSAMTLDALDTSGLAQGVSLHMVRFNPQAGSTE